MTPRDSYRLVLDRFARIGAVVVVAVGAAATVGWLFDIAVLRTGLPNSEAMRVNAACAFIAGGAALFLLTTAACESRWLHPARALAFVTAAFGGMTLAQDLFEIDLGIDELILPEVPRGVHTVHPGRMAPITALSFLIAGLALLALKARRSRVAACAPWLAVLPLFISTLAIAGYAYGVSSLYQVKSVVPMALPSALAFFVLTVSIMAADPAHGIASIAASDTAGGVVVRRLLPTLPLALFSLGWACLEGQKAGLYGTEFGLALMVVLSITVCVFAVIWTAVTLRKVDLTRQRAEAEIINLNAGLERRVEERTLELAQLSAELTTANTSLEQLSLHDGLTSLANRRFFDTYLAAQVAVARRTRRPLALILCDVDAFKGYNDHYGHPGGDECLKQVAATLRSCCRRPTDMAARYGGEEFALILPDTDVSGAEKIAEAVREAIAGLRIPHASSRVAPHITISGGVAVMLPQIDMTVQQLITAADKALYQAKIQGRNRMIFAQGGPHAA